MCSLEKLDDEGNFKGKADMFTKRTIKRAEVVTSVDTASEALAVSLAEKAKIDLDYMGELTGKDKDTLTEELRGVIFQNPLTDVWETADQYLSGNVREKLAIAATYAENHPEYAQMYRLLRRYSRGSWTYRRLRCVSVPHGLIQSISMILCVIFSRHRNIYSEGIRLVCSFRV